MKYERWQRMAAVVLNAPVLLMFLFVCSVFSNSIIISFTRDELLDIRQHTPDNILQVFVYSAAFFGCFDQRGSGPSQMRAQTEKREARRLNG